jgi:hypothetical protein
MAERTARQLGHETRDANVRAIMWFAIGLVVSAIVIHLAVAGLFVLFSRRHPSPEPPSRIVLQPRNLAPEPRLEVSGNTDLERFRMAQAQRLNSYGWVDQHRGIARIPIERAMDLIVQRGLPSRGQGTNDNSGKTPEQMRQEKAAATSAPQVRGEK